ncbi:MAG: MarR family winged helix-turn-helix transcriptional regulator [Solirubrobacteraceae bacterium]
MSANPEPDVQPDPVDWVRDQWAAQGGTDPDQLALTASLMRAHHLVTARLDAALRPHGLSPTAYLMLVTLSLSDRGTRRLSYLARYLMVHQTTVTQMVDQCEKRGLVERRPHPTDRRTTLAVLTREGRTLLRRATKDAAAAGFGLGEIDEATVDELSAGLRVVRHAHRDRD